MATLLAGLDSIRADGHSFSVFRSYGTGDAYLVWYMMLRSWYPGTERLSLILSTPMSTYCYSVSDLEGPCLGAARNYPTFESLSCLPPPLNPCRIGC